MTSACKRSGQVAPLEKPVFSPHFISEAGKNVKRWINEIHRIQSLAFQILLDFSLKLSLSFFPCIPFSFGYKKSEWFDGNPMQKFGHSVLIRFFPSHVCVRRLNVLQSRHAKKKLSDNANNMQRKNNIANCHKHIKSESNGKQCEVVSIPDTW